MSLVDLFPALFDNHFIKIIFIIHATLLFLVDMVSDGYNLILVYTSYNLLLLICILLSIMEDKSSDIILVSFCFEAICILLDVILAFQLDSKFFPILFMVTNTAFRPISALFLLKNYSARAGVHDPTSGILEVTVTGQPGYENRSNS